MVDELSKDKLIEEQTGMSAEAKAKALALTGSFEQYLAAHKDEIDALQFYWSRTRSASDSPISRNSQKRFRRRRSRGRQRSSEGLRWRSLKVRGAAAGRL